MSKTKKTGGRFDMRFADADELELIKKAVREINRKDSDGGKTNVSAFMRSCSVKRARELLGIQ